MNIDPAIIKSKLPHLGKELTDEIVKHSSVMKVDEGQVILRNGQYVKHIPVVLEGLIKVFSRHEEKEFLLYYIKPSESCIMSFSAILDNEPSKILAKAEEPSTILLLSYDKVQLWTHKFYDFNYIFYQQFNIRYADLLSTINSVLFNKIEDRLLKYLREKATITRHNPLKITHKEIAKELGTAREVISRVLKKLENDGEIFQSEKGIEVKAM